ncbi:aspartate--ammonia ligase [Oscillospiraceae bacterium MB08-C2-2]|nr:aspartate--ammonia ligase [Oscillospiraceae bacterium MB08-C2-2]
MSSSPLQIPKGYASPLGVIQTEKAIKLIKDTFERNLAKALHLTRVSAPLFVRPETGLNDNLNGTERPVQFDVLDIGADVQVVQSLAKWKRLALKQYGFEQGHGLYTDMNAIRRDEVLDNLHSVYVDQWDWEAVISREYRNETFLQDIVRRIVMALHITQDTLLLQFPQVAPVLDGSVTFLSTQELEDAYPELTPQERENKVAKEYGAVFLTQIGGALKNGKPHDGRAPDYDDWSLNGDLLVWNPVLERSFELSSMGIRVDAQSLDAQLRTAGCDDRRSLPFHKALLADHLPLTIGGGIGQSRMCMLLLGKAHIGEVQSSVWPEQMIADCEANGIHLL